MWKSHWIDLKFKSIYLLISWITTLGVCLYYKNQHLFLLSKYLSIQNKHFIFTKVTTAFSNLVISSITLSLILILPLGCFFIFLFIIKGFYNYQIYFSLIISLSLLYYYFCCFFTILGYFLTYLIKYLLSFEKTSGPVILLLEARIDQFYLFIIYLFCFQFCCFFIFSIFIWFNINTILYKINLRWYLWAIFYIFIILLTPPDFIFHLVLLGINILFFENLFFIFLFYKFLWQKNFGESRIRTYDDY